MSAVCLSVRPSVCPSVRSSVYSTFRPRRPAYLCLLCVCPSVRPSVYLTSVDSAFRPCGQVYICLLSVCLSVRHAHHNAPSCTTAAQKRVKITANNNKQQAAREILASGRIINVRSRWTAEQQLCTMTAYVNSHWTKTQTSGGDDLLISRALVTATSFDSPLTRSHLRRLHCNRIKPMSISSCRNDSENSIAVVTCCERLNISTARQNDVFYALQQAKMPRK